MIDTYRLGVVSNSTTMFQPIATLIVGIGIIFFAFLQWKVAHDKLRLDLFDRRYKGNDASKKFLAAILRQSNFDDSQLFEFYAGTSDAEFLFGSDVVSYLAKIRDESLQMRLHHESYHPSPADDTERTKHIQAKYEKVKWLTEQFTVMPKIFTPYLGYANIKGNFLEELFKKLET